MTKSIKSDDQFNLIRPLLGNHVLDEYGFPVMKKITISELNLEIAKPVTINAVNTNNAKNNYLVLPFAYDKYLEKYWNNTRTYIPLFQRVMAVGTPDFSVSPFMNINDIRYAIYKNRWIGCTFQSVNISAIPTMQWEGPRSYDLCLAVLNQEVLY